VSGLYNTLVFVVAQGASHEYGAQLFCILFDN